MPAGPHLYQFLQADRLCFLGAEHAAINPRCTDRQSFSPFDNTGDSKIMGTEKERDANSNRTRWVTPIWSAVLLRGRRSVIPILDGVQMQNNERRSRAENNTCASSAPSAQPWRFFSYPWRTVSECAEWNSCCLSMRSLQTKLSRAVTKFTG